MLLYKKLLLMTFGTTLVCRDMASHTVFRRVRGLAKSDYQLRHVRPPFRRSVCPRVITWLTVDGFLEIWYLGIFRISFEKVLVSLNLTRQQELYMKTYVYLWKYLAEFFLECEMFWTKVVGRIKTHILCSITLFSESRTVYVWAWKKYGTAGQTAGNI